jgi:hypothetical protein
VLISDQATNPEKQHRLRGSSGSVGNRGKRSTIQGGSVLLKPVARKFLSKQITCLHGMSRCQLWVIRVTLTVGRPLPLYLDERTSSDGPGMSGWCQWATSTWQTPLPRPTRYR